MAGDWESATTGSPFGVVVGMHPFGRVSFRKPWAPFGVCHHRTSSRSRGWPQLPFGNRAFLSGLPPALLLSESWLTCILGRCPAGSFRKLCTSRIVFHQRCSSRAHGGLAPWRAIFLSEIVAPSVHDVAGAPFIVSGVMMVPPSDLVRAFCGA